MPFPKSAWISSCWCKPCQPVLWTSKWRVRGKTMDYLSHVFSWLTESAHCIYRDHGPWQGHTRMVLVTENVTSFGAGEMVMTRFWTAWDFKFHWMISLENNKYKKWTSVMSSNDDDGKYNLSLRGQTHRTQICTKLRWMVAVWSAFRKTSMLRSDGDAPYASIVNSYKGNFISQIGCRGFNSLKIPIRFCEDS